MSTEKYTPEQLDTIRRAATKMLEALEAVAELLALDEKEGVDCYALRARHDIAEAIADANGVKMTEE